LSRSNSSQLQAFFHAQFKENLNQGKNRMSVFNMPGHLIRRLHQQSTHIFVDRTQKEGFDMTPVQFAALDTIYKHPGSDQAFVAENIGYDRATIGGVIDRLEKKGWVRRVISEHDRRARELSLSAKGHQILTQVQPIVEDLQKDILGPLKHEEQVQLIELLKKLALKDPQLDPKIESQT
jgi:DNA-binding MarR family transcriptional regulator